MHSYDVLRRPIITEKNTLLVGLNKYTFEVAPDANKARGEGFQGECHQGERDPRAGQDATRGPEAGHDFRVEEGCRHAGAWEQD